MANFKVGDIVQKPRTGNKTVLHEIFGTEAIGIESLIISEWDLNTYFFIHANQEQYIYEQDYVPVSKIKLGTYVREPLAGSYQVSGIQDKWVFLTRLTRIDDLSDWFKVEPELSESEYTTF